MTKYLLETSTCSYLMANHTRVKDCLTSAPVTDYPFTCPIVRGEILFGIELLPVGRRRQSLENQANNLFSGLICDPIPERAKEGWEATHELVSNSEIAKSLERAEADVKAGRLKRWDDVRQDLKRTAY